MKDFVNGFFFLFEDQYGVGDHMVISGHWAVAVIDVKIGYRAEVEKAISIIEQVMNQLKKTEENMVGEVSVLGVQELNDSTYTIRATAECNPYTH